MAVENQRTAFVAGASGAIGRELFQRQDEIQTRRDGLIDELEEQLSQRVTVLSLFACEWEVS